MSVTLRSSHALSKPKTSSSPSPRRTNAQIARAQNSSKLALISARAPNPKHSLAQPSTELRWLRQQLTSIEEQSEAFREHVLTSRWNQAYAEQNRLRQKTTSMLRRLQELTRATRAEIADSIGRAQASERETRWGIFASSITACVIALLMMFLVHRTILPIRQLTKAAQALGRGEKTQPIGRIRGDEIGELSLEFNRMANKIVARDQALRKRRDQLEEAYANLVELREQEARTQNELIKKERLAAIGKMTSQVTHELRNPLSSLGLNVEILEEEIHNAKLDQNDEVKELLAAITEEIDRLTQITEGIPRLCPTPPGTPRTTDINLLIRQVLDFVREELKLAKIEVVQQLAEAKLWVHVDLNQLRRALLNLIRNAREAMPSGGKLALRSSNGEEGVVVELQDTGTGIESEALQRIFDPFFSTKESGTGLGLPLTSRSLKNMGPRWWSAANPKKAPPSPSACPKGLRVNKVTEFGPSTSSGLSASSSRSGFAVIVGYYKDSRHRNRRAHEPQKDHFIYKQTQRVCG